MERPQNENVYESPFLQPPPVLLDTVGFDVIVVEREPAVEPDVEADVSADPADEDAPAGPDPEATDPA